MILKRSTTRSREVFLKKQSLAFVQTGGGGGGVQPQKYFAQIFSMNIFLNQPIKQY